MKFCQKKTSLNYRINSTISAATIWMAYTHVQLSQTAKNSHKEVKFTCMIKDSWYNLHLVISSRLPTTVATAIITRNSTVQSTPIQSLSRMVLLPLEMDLPIPSIIFTISHQVMLQEHLLQQLLQQATKSNIKREIECVKAGEVIINQQAPVSQQTYDVDQLNRNDKR